MANVVTPETEGTATQPGVGLRSAPARTLFGSGLSVGMAVFAANGLNALFQIVLARVLSPAEYSIIVALVVITLIAAVPPLAFQASVAREVALELAGGRRGRAGAALRDTVRGLVPWALCVLLLGGIASAVMAAIPGGVGHDGAAATIATAVTVAFALIIPAVWGGLLGARLFLVFGLAQLVFAGTRFTAGLVIGLAGGDAAAVMGGVAAATALTLGLTFLPLRDLWRDAERAGRRRLATLPNAAAATGLTVLMALATVDVLVANLAFASNTAGAYGVASVCARVQLLLPIGVVTVLFPRVATLRDPGRERQHLLAGLAVVATLGALVTTLLWVFADPIVDDIFGEKYAAAVPWLGPLSLAMALYALATVYLYHFLSLARARFALVLVTIQAGQLVAFAVLHGSPSELIGVQIATAAVTVVAAEAWYLLRGRPPA
jgi:O-antigen/teichoic acid export membrane protein